MLEGHEVTVVDNFFTGRKRNVEHWLGHENFELLNHDVVTPLHIEGMNLLFVTALFICDDQICSSVWLAQLVKALAAPTHDRSCVQEVQVRSPERTSSTLASIPPG